MADRPLCIYCKHHIAPGSEFISKEFGPDYANNHWCSKAVSLITGETSHETCSRVRSATQPIFTQWTHPQFAINPCGPEGQWFEPKISIADSASYVQNGKRVHVDE